MDEDGDTIDSEDDDERVQTAAHKAAEFDPYAGVRIECEIAMGVRFSMLIRSRYSRTIDSSL